MTDPVADMLTRIRNGLSIKAKRVNIPRSKLKTQIADVLRREGYIRSVQTRDSLPEEGIGPQGWIEVELKYGPEGEDVISKIERTSRPGRRVYRQAKELRPVLNGLGMQVLSTSRGILSDREARARNIGGEVLATIY
jgi:small subunit ribosomal protein S8